MQTITQWLDAKKFDKPLLVWGPLQSGKKTLLRQLLQRKGYIVVSPENATLLEQHSDYHIFGKPGYLLSMHEVGAKVPSLVKRSPLIYVTDNPYQHGLTKAELANRFGQMVQLRSNVNYEEQRGNFKDRQQNLWQIAQQLSNLRPLKQSPMALQQKLTLADQGDDFLVRVVHQSIYANTSATLDQLATATESLSCGDRLTSSHCLPDEYLKLYQVVIPMESCALESNHLVLSPPSTTNKKLQQQHEKFTSLDLFPSLSQTIATISRKVKKPTTDIVVVVNKGRKRKRNA